MVTLRHGVTSNEWAKIALGTYPSVNKFGRNPDISAAADEDCWDGPTATWVAPTQARTHQIVSTDTGDTSGGAGARTIRTSYLPDWDTPETTVDLTMDGDTNVAHPSAVIIHRMEVLTKGATSSNIGTITATADTDGTVTAQINPGNGKTLMAIYGIPSIYTAYMSIFHTSVERAVSTAFNTSLLYNPEPDAELTNFLVKHVRGGHTNGGPSDASFFPFKQFVGPGILKVRLSVDGNNCDVAGGFDLFLKET